MGLFDRFKKPKDGESSTESSGEATHSHEEHEEDAEHLYQQVALSAASLTTETQLVYAKRESVHVMPSFTAELLRRCVEFETLEDQAALLCTDLRLGADQQKAVIEQLEKLIDQGLLVEHDDVCDLIRENAPSSEASTFSTLGIVTADRPEALARCVGSFLSAIGERQIDVIVVDDSIEPANCEANRAALLELAKTSKVPIRYAGSSERAAFAAAIAEELGSDKEIVDLALIGAHEISDTSGGATNALLLRAAGEKVFICDDNVTCRVAAVPDSEPGLAFSSTPDPTRMLVHPDRASARASVELEPMDLLAEHERVIGRRAAALVAEADADDIDLTGAGPQFLDRTSRGEGVVRVSSTGIAGDAGVPGSSYFLRLSGRAAEEVQYDDQSYRRAIEAHALVRGALTTTISSGSFLMTQAAGFDNSAPLPPCFPVLGNHGELFAHTLAVCEPSASVAHLPWAIDHDPIGENEHDLDDAWRQLADLSAGEIVSTFVRSLMLESEHGESAARMAALGGQLRWLGSLAPAELLETVRRYQWARVGAEMSQFEHRLDNEERMPGLVADHIGRAIEHVTEVLEGNGLGAAGDLLAGRTPEAAQLVFGQLLAGFGRMLELWPQIWAAARAARGRGVDLGEVVG